MAERRHYPDPTGDDCGPGADECTNDNHFVEVGCPSTPGCFGDPAFASPGHGHIDVCQHPREYDGPPLDIEFRETEAMTSALPQFMTLIYLFGAAVNGANRDQRKALHEVKEMLKQKKPLPEIAQAIFDVRGPDWVPDAETMQAIEALHHKEEA